MSFLEAGWGTAIQRSNVLLESGVVGMIDYLRIGVAKIFDVAHIGGGEEVTTRISMKWSQSFVVLACEYCEIILGDLRES